jgi:hypothetical protein
VGLFRRRHETLNEQLLREAGLDPASTLGEAAPRPQAPEPSPSVLTTVAQPHGLSAHSLRLGPNEWDACVTATVPGLAGSRIEFTTIPNGDVIVSEETGDADVSPLADAVERRVDPPYRALAARHDGDLWAVGAKQIEVAQIPFPQGETLGLSRNGADEELRVDGEASDAPVPRELERLGEDTAESFYVEASRIDGDLWEVKVTAL